MTRQDFIYNWAQRFSELCCSACYYDNNDNCSMSGNPHDCFCQYQEKACAIFDLELRMHDIDYMPDEQYYQHYEQLDSEYNQYEHECRTLYHELIREIENDYPEDPHDNDRDCA